MTQSTLNIQYEGENLQIEIVPADHNIQYKANFEHPVFFEKDVDDEGIPFWFEVGGGRTLRAKEMGEEIEKHPDFL